ncbi:MAG: hypothetical protein O3C27_14000 [Actinomycetota bacterium]|nr:hypothetical protein [Actinomycetota bacterium]
MTGSATTSRWIDDASRAFEAALADLLGVRGAAGDPVRVGSIAALGAVAGTLWNDAAGPFFDSDGVRALLGDITRQAVSDRVRRHRLLGLRTGSGRLVYPAFQFDGRQVLRGLPEALTVIAPDDVEGWYVASWFTTTDPGLGGRSPIDALRHGDLPPVLLAVRDLAAGLRG